MRRGGRGSLVPAVIRPALVLAAALGLLFWLAEGLGGIFTGQGTDPNTGLLLILLAACYWPFAGFSNSRHRRDGRRSTPRPEATERQGITSDAEPVKWTEPFASPVAASDAPGS